MLNLEYTKPLRERFLKEAKKLNLGEWICSDYGNDATCSSYSEEMKIQIFYPNSDIHNEENEEYTTYSLVINDGEKYLEFKTLEQVLIKLVTIKNK